MNVTVCRRAHGQGSTLKCTARRSRVARPHSPKCDRCCGRGFLHLFRGCGGSKSGERRYDTFQHPASSTSRDAPLPIEALTAVCRPLARFEHAAHARQGRACCRSRPSARNRRTEQLGISDSVRRVRSETSACSPQSGLEADVGWCEHSCPLDSPYVARTRVEPVLPLVSLIALAAYARNAVYLHDNCRSLRPRDRLAIFALAPLYGVLHLFVLSPLRFWSLATLRRTRWGTRQHVEVRYTALSR